MTTINRLAPNDAAGGAAWDRFVMSCPEATFFHRSAWQRIIGSVFRHDTYFLFAEDDGKVSGVLPMAHVKSLLFGNSLVSLPFAVYGGVAASGDSIAHELERYAQSLAKTLNVGSLELRNRIRRHETWPAQDIYVTFRKQISSDLESNRQSIPRKQRAMIRKAEKRGLKSVIQHDVGEFFALYSDNVHRHGTPALAKAYFEVLLTEFKDDSEILTVRAADGAPLSSVLSFYFRDEVLPYYAGDDIRAREMAANDFKYWELMSRAATKKVEMFDFGRSKLNTGSYAFKKNWGFEPSPLFYEYCLYKKQGVPQNNPANAKFRLLIEAWKRMPLGLANLLGPHIVRNLG